MHITIIGDTFPPMRTSGAIMLKDLADEMVAQGHMVSVIVPSDTQTQGTIDDTQGVIRVLYVKALKTKDVGYLQRVISEFLNPYLMWFRLKIYKSFFLTKVDLIIWYSPTIFWGPLVKRIKNFIQIFFWNSYSII